MNANDAEDEPEQSLNPLDAASGGEEGVQDTFEHQEGSIAYVVVASCIGFFLFGYDTGVVSGAADWAQKEFGLSDGQLGVAVGITAVAAAAACLTASWMNNHYGRRVTIMISASLYTLGALMVAFSTGFASIVAGRTILGWAIGLATTTVPLYVAECVPPSQRGRMITLNDLCVASGQVVAGLCNIIAKPHWRLSMGIAAVPAAVQFVMFITLPESPRVLARQGKTVDADAVFKRFNGNSDAALLELRGMHHQVRQSIAATPFLDAWRTAAHRRAFLLGMFMMVMNQASGINTVMYYSAKLLETAGFSETEAIWGALVCDITQAVGVCISLYYMEKLGRRKLAILSASLVFPFISMLGASFLGGLRAVSLVCVGGYLFSFGLGLSGVPWTVNSEIFALPIRSQGQAQAIFTNWFLNGIIAIVFRMFIDDLLSFFFFFFGFVSLTGAIWMYRYLPETKGLTLEQIEGIFRVPLSTAVRNGPPALELDEEEPQ
eukprot:TRINITY_DN33479_c0_g1_i1.p1 TRINITY_DN33479_c0_g1~~TRINITY_DN33479_c0_g1_i1.p1  ORF type:complete len:491 (+),score=100.31 TRINITY_DN33479_c0_g1_i1:54-1526(+)